MKQHKCDMKFDLRMPSNYIIEERKGYWVAKIRTDLNVEYVHIIYYCPFCREKLE